MTIVISGDKGLTKAAELLKSGELVSIPTETVYGLAANALDSIAVAKIFETKGRPQFNPLIVHVPNIETACKIGKFNTYAMQLAEHFWPGPMTLVVPQQKNNGISDLVTAGLQTIAIRIPGHPIAQSLLKQTGLPLAAPSANISGHVSPTTPEHVLEDFKDKNLLILDGGPTDVGIESTVINCIDNIIHILRPGSITAIDIEKLLDRKLIYNCDENEKPVSPGQLLSHYAPNADIRLNAISTNPDEALLAFGENIPEHQKTMINLSKTGDLREAAANLFAALRELDNSGADHIAVMPIPDEGLGIAINDRLKRAAAPRK